ncbi:MAG TPA: hypothetical protein VKZ69_04930 [Limnochordales bacterium]|nr:hypothetical protein [Limnochordales bacterium]
MRGGRLAIIAAGLGLWAWWGWSRLWHPAVPAYGPVAHHLAALHRHTVIFLISGGLLLAALGWELYRRGRRRRPGAPRGPATVRSEGIRPRRAETRVHASGR